MQLIDEMESPRGERFDKPLADLFDMQDEIVARQAGALNDQIFDAEARRASVSNPDSVDLHFQGQAWLDKAVTPDKVAQARTFSTVRSPPSRPCR